MHLLLEASVRLRGGAARLQARLQLCVQQRIVHSIVRLPSALTWATCVVLGLLACESLAGQEVNLVRVEVCVPPEIVGVVRVIPLTPGAKVADGRFTNGAATASVPRDTPSLLCAAAENTAVFCEAIRQPIPPIVEPVLAEGRQVVGTCYVGREHAANAVVRLQRPDVSARVPYLLPLAFADGRLTSEVVANERGEFVIEHLLPGRYQFEVTPRGHPPQVVTVLDVPERRRLPNGALEARRFELPGLTVALGSTVTASVVGDDGAPVANATVGMFQPAGADGASAIFSDGTTGKSGEVELSGLDALRTAVATCSATGFARATIRFDVFPATVICTLEPLGGLRGTVATEDGTPISGASIRVGDRESRSSADGSFAIGALNPGGVNIAVQASGYASHSQRVEVSPGADQDVGEIVLAPGTLLKGHVLDSETGRPLSGALVSCVDRPMSKPTLTNDDGEFEIEAELGVTLEGTASGFAATDVVASSTEGTVLRLQQPGSLDVSVWDELADVPCAGCSIIASSGRHVLPGLTNGDGNVSFHDLTPGPYDVTREHIEVSSSAITIAGGVNSVSADIRSGRTTHVSIGRKRDTVEVVFVPSMADPRRLSVTGPSGSQVVSQSATGSFQIKRPVGGASLALFQGMTGATVGDVPADFAGSRFEVRLQTGAVQTRCTWKGQPEDGVDVTLRDARGQIAGWTRSGVDGGVLIPNVRSGAYTLLAVGRAPVTLLVSSGTTIVPDLATN